MEVLFKPLPLVLYQMQVILCINSWLEMFSANMLMILTICKAQTIGLSTAYLVNLTTHAHGLMLTILSLTSKICWNDFRGQLRRRLVQRLFYGKVLISLPHISQISTQWSVRQKTCYLSLSLAILCTNRRLSASFDQWTRIVVSVADRRAAPGSIY